MNFRNSDRIPHTHRVARIHRTITWRFFAALFLFYIAPLCLSAQNLVPNPSFEILTTPGVPPDDEYQIDRAAGWTAPTGGTSDFYYINPSVACGTATSQLNNWCPHVPLNIMGSQNPFDPNPLDNISYSGYAGIRMQLTPTSDQPREYIAIELNSDPDALPNGGLVAGRTYNISFYASLAEVSKRATAQIGAVLLTGAEYSNRNPSVGGYFRMLNSTAELTPDIQASTCLDDMTNWQLVQGTYVASGGEKHIVIGCFAENLVPCQIVSGTGSCTDFPSAPSFPDGYLYYYIDEVSVVAANSNSECNVCDAIDVYAHVRNNTNPCCWEVNYVLPEWIKYQPACNITSNPITSVRVVSPSGETVSLTPDGAWTTSGNNFNYAGGVPYTHPLQPTIVMGTVCLNTSNSSTPKSLTFEFRRADGSLFCTKQLVDLSCEQACQNCPIDFKFFKVANIAGGKDNSITGCCFEYSFTLKKKPTPECSIMGYRITRIGSGNVELTFDPAAFPIASYGGPTHSVKFHNPIPAGATYTMGTMCFNGFGTSLDGKERIKIELLDANGEPICEKYYNLECDCCDGLILESEAPISPTDRCCWNVKFNSSNEQSCFDDNIYSVSITEPTGQVDVTINSPAPGTPFDLSQSLGKICIDAADAPLNTNIVITLKGQKGEVLCSKTVSKLNCESCCEYLELEAERINGSGSTTPLWPCRWKINVKMPEIGCEVYGVRLLNMFPAEPLGITEALPLQSTPINITSFTTAGSVALYGASSIPAAATVKVQLLGANGEVLCERLIGVTCGSHVGDAKIGTGMGETSEDNSSMLYMLPNPSADQTTVHYTVRADAYTELALYDATGRQVRVLHSANKPVGEYALSVKTDSLPSGTYYIKMHNGNQVFTTQLIVVH